jgi:hypothetical protein
MATSVPAHALQSVSAKPLPLGVRGSNRTSDQEYRDAASTLLRTARGDCTQAQWGEACGADQQRASKWEDTSRTDSVTLVQLVRALSSRRGRAVVASLARGLLALTEAPAAAGDLCERVCAAMAEGGDVARVVLQAWSDKRIDAAERDAAVREIDEAIEALTRLRSDVLTHAQVSR